MHAGKTPINNAVIYDASEAATSHNTTKKRMRSSTKRNSKTGTQKRNRLASAHQLGV